MRPGRPFGRAGKARLEIAMLGALATALDLEFLRPRCRTDRALTPEWVRPGRSHQKPHGRFLERRGDQPGTSACRHAPPAPADGDVRHFRGRHHHIALVVIADGVALRRLAFLGGLAFQRSEQFRVSRLRGKMHLLAEIIQRDPVALAGLASIAAIGIAIVFQQPLHACQLRRFKVGKAVWSSKVMVQSGLPRVSIAAKGTENRSSPVQ